MASSFDVTRSFGDIANASGTSAPTRLPQPAPKPEAVVDLSALQNASRVLHDQFVKDSQIIPDIGDTLTIRVFLPCPIALCFMMIC
jgi:hypothetical protein